MTIRTYHGCYGETTDVDGRNINDFAEEELEALIRRIQEHNLQLWRDGSLFLYDFLHMGLCEFDKDFCEQCGHHAYTETFEIT